LTPELESWMSPSGRVVLLGDAAHAIPPAAAQGSGMGFEDAETLAYVLSRLKTELEVQDSAAPLPSMREYLRKWETARKERLKAVVDFTKLTAKLRLPSKWRVVQMAKEWLISAVMGFKGEEGFRWLMGYDATSEEVRKAVCNQRL
jgi:2-polyprenyl-6-methoxyphenol hydroxylase-like FAD-dependent oxidoreductase